MNFRRAASAFLLLAFLTAISALGGSVRFRAHDIAGGLAGGYQVVAVDMNGDFRTDLLAVPTELGELCWFENPSWQRQTVCDGISGMINVAAKVPAQGFVRQLILAHGFSSDPAKSSGILTLLEKPEAGELPWARKDLDAVPTAHRLYWASQEKAGSVLILVPLAGPDSSPPNYPAKTPIWLYRPGNWAREMISDKISGVVHGAAVVDWDGDGSDDLLTASFDGIDLLIRTPDLPWKRTHLADGNPERAPRGGSSEIAVGHLGGRRFLAAIEPWHGNMVAVYRAERDLWTRKVIDSTLNDGHTLTVHDFDGDGRGEILAGCRGGDGGVFLFYATDEQGNFWAKETVDVGGMAAAGCTVADLDGDGLDDVACIGTRTANLKWYENLGPLDKQR